uniref:Uncharacterized protein n=1 Tax=Heterorhabditis bacteriophora TaxID=37862 RepID=A0A1I7XL87_HETBA
MENTKEAFVCGNGVRGLEGGTINLNSQSPAVFPLGKEDTMDGSGFAPPVWSYLFHTITCLIISEVQAHEV